MAQSSPFVFLVGGGVWCFPVARVAAFGRGVPNVVHGLRVRVCARSFARDVSLVPEEYCHALVGASSYLDSAGFVSRRVIVCMLSC